MSVWQTYVIIIKHHDDHNEASRVVDLWVFFTPPSTVLYKCAVERQGEGEGKRLAAKFESETLTYFVILRFAKEIFMF